MARLRCCWAPCASVALPAAVLSGLILVLALQLYLNPEGYYQPVLTELEICPSAQGFAHAMQVGYGLRADLAESIAGYLKGRDFLIVGSQQWSEFIIEQFAFCRALAGLGVKARVLYDIPISVMADEIKRGQRWQLPLFGIKEKPAQLDTDLMARLKAHCFDSFLWPGDGDWPEEVGEAVWLEDLGQELRRVLAAEKVVFGNGDDWAHVSSSGGSSLVARFLSAHVILASSRSSSLSGLSEPAAAA